MAKREKKETKLANGLPHAQVLNTLASQVSRAQSYAREAAGEVGSLMKNAESAHGIDRKAFKLTVQLKGMDSSKMNQFLKHFDHYRTVFTLDDLAGQDMLDAAPQTSYGEKTSKPDEDEKDVRPPHLIEQERQRLAEEVANADTVAANVTKLRHGVKGLPGAEAAGPAAVH